MSIVFSTTFACGSNTACTTGKSTTLTMCCQLSRPAPVEPAPPAQQGHRPPCGCTATVESTSSSRRLDLGDQPLRHNKDLQHSQDQRHLWNLRGHLHSQTMGTCRCTTTAKSTTLSKICTCRISTGFRTVCPVGTCLSLEMGTVAFGKTVGAAVLVVTGAAPATVRVGVTYMTRREACAYVTVDAGVPYTRTGTGCTCPRRVP